MLKRHFCIACGLKQQLVGEMNYYYTKDVVVSGT